jgi:hypothetical protein
LTQFLAESALTQLPPEAPASWLCQSSFARIYTVSIKSPAAIPVSTCSGHEEANLIWFANIPSIILSDPGKTPDPVPEHALDVVKSEIIPYLCNRVLNLITRGKLSISQDML